MADVENEDHMLLTLEGLETNRLPVAVESREGNRRVTHLKRWAGGARREEESDYEKR